jgi:PIN domain nuclease of toxin-antitoxin system
MMGLLDTHSFLWFINDDEDLSVPAREVIEDPANTIFFSAASLWEMAIKVSLGRLVAPLPFDEFMLEQLRQNDITLLEIKVEHAGLVATLPFYHRDPFDRLIIAQAIIEKIPIIGKDDIFEAYDVQRLW